MKQGINRVLLLGRIGARPELKTSTKGTPYARLNIATHRTQKTSDDEFSEVTDWHRVYVWGRDGENCTKYLQKGQFVAVEGYLSYFDSKPDELSPAKKLPAITAQKIQFLPHTGFCSES